MFRATSAIILQVRSCSQCHMSWSSRDLMSRQVTTPSIVGRQRRICNRHTPQYGRRHHYPLDTSPAVRPGTFPSPLRARDATQHFHHRRRRKSAVDRAMAIDFVIPLLLWVVPGIPKCSQYPETTRSNISQDLSMALHHPSPSTVAIRDP